jgi:hypothetical protein
VEKAKWEVRRGEWRAVRREGAEVGVDRTTYPCILLWITMLGKNIVWNNGLTVIVSSIMFSVPSMLV